MGRTGQASIHAALDDFTTKLRRRQFPDSSVALARHTTETLIHAVAAQQSPTVEGIIEGVRAVSQKLVDARPLGARSRPPSTFSRLLLSLPRRARRAPLAHASVPNPNDPTATELVVGNMCRRVLHIIREEAEHSASATRDDEGSKTGDGDDPMHRMKRFKSEVIESVGELIDELEAVTSHVNAQALEHVSPGSVVLVAGGGSRAETHAVEAFLREANRKRAFQVVVAEPHPSGPGHDMAKTLADKGVETTVVADAATFAVMPRAHLVVLSARGVFADGAALCSPGNRAVAVAAKAHRVPVIVLAGTHQLSPLGPNDPEYDADELASPAGVFDYARIEPHGESGNFVVANPLHDRVAPELITLFVTDAGGQVPGFIASLMGEFYSPEDRRFEE